MEKNANILENKIKVLTCEEDRAKKGMEREIKTKEENLKIISEISKEKEEIQRIKQAQSREIDTNIKKIEEMREHIHKTIKEYKDKVLKKNKKEAKIQFDIKKELDELKQIQKEEMFEKNVSLAESVRKKHYEAQKKKEDSENTKKQKLKEEIMNKLKDELKTRKALKVKKI